METMLIERQFAGRRHQFGCRFDDRQLYVIRLTHMTGDSDQMMDSTHTVLGVIRLPQREVVTVMPDRNLLHFEAVSDVQVVMVPPPIPPPPEPPEPPPFFNHD